MTKALTKGEPILSILFWLTLMQAVFGTVAMTAFGTVTLPTIATLPWLVLIGIPRIPSDFSAPTALSLAPPHPSPTRAAGLTAHSRLPAAVLLPPACTVVPVDCPRLPIIAVVGALFYDEQVPPTLFAGAALIFLGIWLTLRGGTSAPQGQAVTKP